MNETIALDTVSKASDGSKVKYGCSRVNSQWGCKPAFWTISLGGELLQMLICMERDHCLIKCWLRGVDS